MLRRSPTDDGGFGTDILPCRISIVMALVVGSARRAAWIVLRCSLSSSVNKLVREISRRPARDRRADNTSSTTRLGQHQVARRTAIKQFMEPHVAHRGPGDAGYRPISVGGDAEQ